MKFTQSLKKTFQFKKVYDNGKSLANKFLVLYVLENNEILNKLGVSVSKKVGNSVVRSRVTRLIKENYRLLEEKLDTGYDFVFIARISCSEATYKDIENSMINLLKRHKKL